MILPLKSLNIMIQFYIPKTSMGLLDGLTKLLFLKTLMQPHEGNPGSIIRFKISYELKNSSLNIICIISSLGYSPNSNRKMKICRKYLKLTIPGNIELLGPR